MTTHRGHIDYKEGQSIRTRGAAVRVPNFRVVVPRGAKSNMVTTTFPKSFQSNRSIPLERIVLEYGGKKDIFDNA
jgi:hypothetical protein